MCRGCQTQEDCGRCRVCLRPARPGLKRQWRCLQRRCFWVSQAGGATLVEPRRARAHSAVTFATDAAVASSRWLCLPHVFFSFLSMLTSLVLPTCLSLPALCPSLPWSPSRMSPVPSSGCGFPYCECLTAHSSRPVIACSLHSLGVLCRPGTTKPQLSLLLG